jgi:hypothetical protein
MRSLLVNDVHPFDVVHESGEIRKITPKCKKLFWRPGDSNAALHFDAGISRDSGPVALGAAHPELIVHGTMTCCATLEQGGTKGAENSPSDSPPEYSREQKSRASEKRAIPFSLPYVDFATSQHPSNPLKSRGGSFLLHLRRRLSVGHSHRSKALSF